MSEELRQTNRSYQDIINGIVNRVATHINEFAIESETQTAVAEELKESLINRVGVNTDEELAHIQQLQTMYAANAKIITAVNNMLRELLAAV